MSGNAKIRQAAIVAAIAELDPVKGFTKDGRPDLKAIEALRGFEVTAKERDGAWKVARKKAAAKENAAVTIDTILPKLRDKGLKV